MLRCGHCDKLIQPVWAKNHGHEYHYYTCAGGPRWATTTARPALSAGEIEALVVDQVRILLRHPDLIARTYREIQDRADRGPHAEAVARLAELCERRDQTQQSNAAVLSVAEQDDGFLAAELKRLKGELRARTFDSATGIRIAARWTPGTGPCHRRAAVYRSDLGRAVSRGTAPRARTAGRTDQSPAGSRRSAAPLQWHRADCRRAATHSTTGNVRRSSGEPGLAAEVSRNDGVPGRQCSRGAHPGQLSSSQRSPDGAHVRW